MKWLVCKAEHEFNKEQDCSMYRATECVETFNDEEEALDALHMYDCIDYNDEFIYIVINSDQIGEFLR